ncbi:hypothetical protein FHX42_002137 [Saccharopolyspora lacisalsi]|uniref:HMA domain-containing protein n=1 Tax=Halosaccharopolyspora lacisalsi TaxID=1000566 RepID=A0A839DV49_9PSEU|nr:hypothetical protein [Halosaccharopolyspora lacisalsi]MBA8824790.1 hypothetical protein [Halosaccharopolyspora lacisalsi]
MVLGRLLSTASEAASSVVRATSALAGSPAGRRSWSSGDRTHLEVRGLHRSDNAALAEAVRQHLRSRQGVEDVRINATLGRAIVRHDRELVGTDELARVLGDVEHEHDLDHAETAPAGEHHPGNPVPLLREVGAFGVSVVGLGYAAATSLPPIRLFPSVVPATVSLVESVPWMRSTVQQYLGRQATDTVLATVSTVSQVLARSPLALTVTACYRLCACREVLARHHAWHRWERSVGEYPQVHHADPVEAVARPRPLPSGPVERVSDVAGTLALLGYGATLTLAPQRAVAMMQAATPRAGKMGREAFATQLSTTLSGRASLVLDPDVLRRLDRVDTVVLDLPALPSAELAAAARSVGHVVTTELGADGDHLPLNATGLAETVRELQTEGAVVAVVSARDRPTLTVADVGIGVVGDSGSLPWGAHVTCFDLADARTLIGAVAPARTTSRYSARLTVVASWLGALFGSLGPAYGSSSRASMPIGASALIALGLGTWWGTRATTGQHSPRYSIGPSHYGKIEETSSDDDTHSRRVTAPTAACEQSHDP